MKVGDRVRVSVPLAKREQWSRHALISMQLKAGTITEARYGLPVRYLVQFDSPAAPWHANQLPVEAFWFDEDELVVLEGAS